MAEVNRSKPNSTQSNVRTMINVFEGYSGQTVQFGYGKQDYPKVSSKSQLLQTKKYHPAGNATTSTATPNGSAAQSHKHPIPGKPKLLHTKENQLPKATVYGSNENIGQTSNPTIEPTVPKSTTSLPGNKPSTTASTATSVPKAPQNPHPSFGQERVTNQYENLAYTATSVPKAPQNSHPSFGQERVTNQYENLAMVRRDTQITHNTNNVPRTNPPATNVNPNKVHGRVKVSEKGKNSEKSILSFVNNPNFLHFFDKYVSSYKSDLDNLNTDLDTNTRDIFFLLLASDVFCQIKKGNYPRVGKEILYFYQNPKGVKVDFLYNKKYPGDGLIRTINNGCAEGKFKTLLHYLLHYSHNIDGEYLSPITLSFKILHDIENVNNPEHKIDRDEIECTVTKLIEYQSVVTKNNMSFENFYRFYNEHELKLKCELGLQNVEKEIKKTSHDLLEKVEKTMPSTKLLEAKVSDFFLGLKRCVSSLF